MTASVGIAVSDAASRSGELLRNADIAMYNAKRDGTARHAIFNTSMHKRVVTRLRLETELREAIEADRLRVFYQPIVDIGTGQLAGFEALARWPVDTPARTPDRVHPGSGGNRSDPPGRPTRPAQGVHAARRLAPSRDRR